MLYRNEGDKDIIQDVQPSEKGCFEKRGQRRMLAGVVALAYLLLCCRVVVDAGFKSTGHTIHVHIALRVFHVCLHLIGTLDGGAAQSGIRRQAAFFRRYGRLMLAAIRTLRFGHTKIHAVLGLGDAAHTALTAGAAQAVLLCVCAVIGQAGKADVRIMPDFSRKRLAASGRCIFSLALGDVIFAVVKEAVKKTQREGFKWLSTPLKA